jgi:hypothetical protein
MEPFGFVNATRFVGAVGEDAILANNIILL